MEDVEKICEGTVAMFDMAYKAQPKELNEPQTLRWNIATGSWSSAVGCIMKQQKARLWRLQRP